jgi:hypothetical protein
MTETIIMKILKITSILLVSGMLILVLYANTRQLSPTEKLAPVNLVSFKMQRGLASAQASFLENNISKISGVTACTVSDDGTIASIIFHPDKITEQELASAFPLTGNIKATPIAFPTSRGCPMHAVTGSVQQFISVLDLRN